MVDAAGVEQGPLADAAAVGEDVVVGAAEVAVVGVEGVVAGVRSLICVSKLTVHASRVSHIVYSWTMSGGQSSFQSQLRLVYMYVCTFICLLYVMYVL